MSSPYCPDCDTLSLHAGMRCRSGHPARATPIYLTSAFVFKRFGPHRGASQAGTRGPCLFAHFQSDQRSAGKTHRGGRRRRDRDRGRQRTGCDASWVRNYRLGRVSYLGIPPVVWRLTQPASYTLKRFRIKLSTSTQAIWMPGVPQSGGIPKGCSAKRSAIQGGGAGYSAHRGIRT